MQYLVVKKDWSYTPFHFMIFCLAQIIYILVMQCLIMLHVEMLPFSYEKVHMMQLQQILQMLQVILW